MADYTMVAWRSPTPDGYSSSCQPSWPSTICNQEQPAMKTWRKPKTIEIAVGTEINAYACAGL
ncbi:pyrroloquinoline quinone precursor peptide PqqA [Azospirillum sp. B510]|uniref:pyrroloquinoline quinone precursor peptide PqqA n=1 Tax=Azospirillum sp. (strain B510) TaxID=137722 RepID=UPI001FFF69B8|nr:pyrroloquinoline quinone precursor peptide PqqA [Azospirillum sp. B510]